jgi:hypothetical protein
VAEASGTTIVDNFDLELGFNEEYPERERRYMAFKERYEFQGVRSTTKPIIYALDHLAVCLELIDVYPA